MAKITENSIQMVKQTATMLDLASEFVALKREGAEYVGFCPYPDHQEKTPSFYVNPEKGVYLCRGECGRGGDLIKLVEDLMGLEFVEAVEYIADRSGVELEYAGETEDERQRTQERRTERDSALQALEAATKDYRNYLLNSPDEGARRAREYLVEDRGFDADIMKDFRIGYAPQFETNKGFCRSANERHGLDDVALAEAGLVTKKGNHDRFAGRVTFPFTDSRGRVVGFAGRVLPGDPETRTRSDGKEYDISKYLNSKESPLFDKSKLIYGLDLALPNIRKERQVVVVEGYTDVIMLHQAGIRSTVGIAGTALTKEHLRMLSPHAEVIYLVFDPDKAGEKATERARQSAEQKLDMRVVVLDLDPADWLGEHSTDEFEALLKASPGVVEHMISRRAEAARDADPMTRSQEFKPVQKLVAELEDHVLRNEYARRAAGAFGVSIDNVLEGSRRRSTSGDSGAKTKSGTEDPVNRAERYLLAMALCYPKDAAPVFSEGVRVEGIEEMVVLTRDDFASEDLGALYEEIRERAAAGRPFATADLMVDEDLREHFGLIAQLDGEAEDAEEEVRTAVARESYLRVAMLSRRRRRSATDDESPEWDKLYAEEVALRDAIAGTV